MKVLVIAAALGLTASAAMADCAGHKPVTAATEVDRTIMTASVRVDTNTVATDQTLPVPQSMAPDTSKNDTIEN